MGGKSIWLPPPPLPLAPTPLNVYNVWKKNEEIKVNYKIFETCPEMDYLPCNLIFLYFCIRMLSFSSLFYAKNIENKYVTRRIQIICKNKQSIIFFAVEFQSQDHSAIVYSKE